MRTALFFAVLAAGIATGVLAATFPALERTPGVEAPVIALEFARTAAAVEKVTGGHRPEVVGPLKSSIHHDGWFIPAYTAFLALAVGLLARRNVWAWVGVGLALTAGVFDYLENMVLLKVLDRQEGWEGALSNLYVFTWIKWGCLAAAFLWLARVQWPDSGVGKVCAVWAVATFAAGVGAWWGGVDVLWFTRMVSLAFLMLLGWVVYRQFRSRFGQVFPRP